MTNRNITGADLLAFRRSFNMSQRAFGDYVGLHHTTISKLENDILDIKNHIHKYEKVGFGNPTTFTSEEYQELREYYKTTQQQLNQIKRDIHIKSVDFGQFSIKLNEYCFKLDNKIANDNKQEDETIIWRYVPAVCNFLMLVVLVSYLYLTM